MFETLDDSELRSGTGPGAHGHAEEQQESSGIEGPAILAFWAAGALVLISFFIGSSGSLRGFTAVTYLAVAVFAIGVFWRLRKHPWYWTTLAILLAIHVPLVIYAPFSEWSLHHKGMALVVFADLLVYCAGIVAAKKLFEFGKGLEGEKK